jgi:hypothetical protein
MRDIFARLRPGAWPVALLAASAPVIMVSAVAGWQLLMYAALLLSYLADSLLYTRDRKLAAWLGPRQLASAPRALFRESFALLGWVVAIDPPTWAILLAMGAISLIHLTHAGYRLVSTRSRRLRHGRPRWVNLDVDGLLESAPPLPPTLPVLGPVAGPRFVLHIDVLLLLGFLLSWATRSMTPVVVAATLVTFACGWVAWRVVSRHRFILTLPTPAQEEARLRVALEGLAPEVAVYFSGSRGSTYQLNVWLETIDRFHRPTVIILRQALHLEDLVPTTTPIIVLPTARDVEEHQVPSLKVALYPTTVIKNNHMIRLRGLRHVFINHGDGDKSVTYSPLHRVFDEIWVAGQAACDRYLNHGEGIRRDQLVKVGRPQLAHIRQVPANRPADPLRGPMTVLYAPTWEGNFDDVDYSSVAPMGETIIETLLRSPRPLRILFKSHPATGSRLPEAAVALARIEARLREAPGDHAVLGSGPAALYDAFNEADVLIADISSVVADFLASRKPYLVTNPISVPEAEFRRDFPSASGGGIVQCDAANLSTLIEDAAGPDSLRGQRVNLAEYFLGTPVADPIEHFADEVDRACAQLEHGKGPHQKTASAAPR